jgi:hypothetical protein
MNSRSVCEICGRSSDTALGSCGHCGVLFASEFSPSLEPEVSVPLGGDQGPRLFVNTGTFLAEGRLGEIGVGCARTDVKRIAGTPADFSRGESLEDAEVWINGPITFWFNKSRVERIGVYFILDYPRNEAIAFDADFPRRGDRIDQIVEFMERSAIRFDKREGSVLTSGNVEILWSKTDRTITSLVAPSMPMRKRMH